MLVCKGGEEPILWDEFDAVLGDETEYNYRVLWAGA